MDDFLLKKRLSQVEERGAFLAYCHEQELGPSMAPLKKRGRACPGLARTGSRAEYRRHKELVLSSPQCFWTSQALAKTPLFSLSVCLSSVDGDMFFSWTGCLFLFLQSKSTWDMIPKGISHIYMCDSFILWKILLSFEKFSNLSFFLLLICMDVSSEGWMQGDKFPSFMVP